MDLIEIRNLDNKPLTLRHDGKGNVTIDPGAKRILPLDYATIHFGHPAARNEGKDKARDVEYKNARRMWGFYPGIYDEADWEAMRPKVECYDLDGERVYMVLDDPDGTYAAKARGHVTAGQSDAVEARGVERQIAAMQAQIDKLTGLLLAQHHGLPGADAPLPTDAGQDGTGEPGEAPEGDTEPDDGSGQAKRNEARDNIPKPADDEPAVVKDKPRTTRVGGKR